MTQILVDSVGGVLVWGVCRTEHSIFMCRKIDIREFFSLIDKTHKRVDVPITWLIDSRYAWGRYEVMEVYKSRSICCWVSVTMTSVCQWQVPLTRGHFRITWVVVTGHVTFVLKEILLRFGLGSPRFDIPFLTSHVRSLWRDHEKNVARKKKECIEHMTTLTGEVEGLQNERENVKDRHQDTGVVNHNRSLDPKVWTTCLKKREEPGHLFYRNLETDTEHCQRPTTVPKFSAWKLCSKWPKVSWRSFDHFVWHFVEWTHPSSDLSQLWSIVRPRQQFQS